MLEHTQTAGPITLNTLYALPKESRNNRSGIRLFVNQRAIEHRNLAFALIQAFKPWLPENRFPIVFLYLSVSPEEVDVNVHPMKREVRFQNESGLFEMIKSFYTQILQSGQQALPRAEGDFHPIRASQAAVADPTGAGPSRMADSFWSPKRIQSAMGQYMKRGDELSTMGGVENETVTGYAGSSAQGPSFYSPAPLLGSESFAGEAFHLLGSAGKHYAVFTTADGLYIMDYHAVHERQLYEKLMAAKPEHQTLLFPVHLELSSSAYQWFLAFQDDFEQMGFEFSRASGNSLLVSAQPAAIHSLDLQAFLNDLITQLSSEIPLSQTADPISEKLAKTMACHSAVRSGKLPSVLDLQRLVRDLLEKPILSTCPHGRPTFLFYAWSNLDKAFKRA
jgi:DNA mismatch repair protein MutL